MDAAGDGYAYRPEGFGHDHLIGHLILLVLLLVAVAAGIAVGLALARRDDLTRRGLAREAIYRDVRKAIDRTLIAQGADLINAAQRLLDTIRQRLGPLTDLQKTLSAPADAIGKALAGKVTDPVKPAPPAPPPAAKDQATTVIVNPPSLVTRINVVEPDPKENPPPAKPPEPEKPAERDMTLKEQLSALRQAVESFSGAWERGSVDRVLEAAQAALLDARPGREAPK
jgi:hypothetical protein